MRKNSQIVSSSDFTNILHLQLDESPSDHLRLPFQLYLYGIARRELYDMILPDESPYDGSEQSDHSGCGPALKPIAAGTGGFARASSGSMLLWPPHTETQNNLPHLCISRKRKAGYLPARLRKKLVEVLGGLSQSTYAYTRNGLRA